MNRLALVILSLLLACGGTGGTGDGGAGGGGGSSGAATITSDVPTVSMIATACTTTCTVSKTVMITSSTTWTSTTPGFGGLSGFTVAPDAGPAGTTPVVISYSADCCPSPANGFIRFRSTTIGVYAEVNVIVTVN